MQILIVDDHPLFRRGLRQIIEEELEMSIAGEAADGLAALDLLQTIAPDIAVLDLHMPRMGGLDLIRELRERRPALPVVVLTMYRDRETFEAALDLHVRGYLLKETALAEIHACLRAVAAGEPYVTPLLSGFLLDRRRRRDALEAAYPGIASLTPFEKRVLRRVRDMLTSRQIAEEFQLSPRTIENTRTAICGKLGLTGGGALVRFALEHRTDLE